MLKAAEVNGSVRVISRDTGQGQLSNQADDGTGKGVTQVWSRLIFCSHLGGISPNFTDTILVLQHDSCNNVKHS